MERGSHPASSSRFNWGDYAALSYVWGDENVTKTILVNGEEREVTANLEEALRSIAVRGEFGNSLKLWIDAISINQDDLEERGRQVRRMREIYGNSQTVIAWLGEEYDQSHKAIELVRELAKFGKKDGGKKLEKSLRDDPGLLGNGCWLALQEFMDRR